MKGSSPEGHDEGFLDAFCETRGFLLGRPARATVTADGAAVIYLRSEPRHAENSLWQWHLATGIEQRLLSPRDILGAAQETLSDEEKARRERLRITDTGFAGFSLSPDGKRILTVLTGRLYLFDRVSGQVERLLDPDLTGALDPRFSPDGRQVAFVRARALWIVDAAGGVPVRVSPEGTPTVQYGSAEFVAQEEMSRHEGHWFSPDSRHIAFAEVDESDVELFQLSDPYCPERPPSVFRYPRAGRANARVRLGVTTLGEPANVGEPAKAIEWLDWDRDRLPYLARVFWSGPRELSFLVQSRDQRRQSFMTASLGTPGVRVIFEERDATWLNLDNALPRPLPGGGGFLNATEAQGSRALELRGADGVVAGTLVHPGEGFLAFVGFVSPPDPAATHGLEALVLVGDALTSRVARVPIPRAPGTAMRMLSDDDGCDRSVSAGRGGAAWVETRVGPSTLPETRVVSADGKVLAVIPEVAETPPHGAQLEFCTVGEPAFHAVVIRPRAFEKTRKYPVIVHVYGGPHSLMVRADWRHYLLDQWIADHGAIVVAIDNRGTPRRDRAWERSVAGRFGDVPLADQVEALRALGARFPELDLGRVGIYGWSFGGYMAALAVLRRPDVFKVAVAGAPVVDWRDYDTHYTERYLGHPDTHGDAYDAASLLTYAADLHRPLLLVHGTADDNVFALHSLKLADALTRAGRSFDFLPLPGTTHQVSDARVRRHLWHTTAAYLLGRL